jgi:transposase-like protein
LKKTAFVLGNGTSRKSIDLNQLKEHGTVYGCNALYREFEPDYLVAVDAKMILEINKAGYQHDHSVWTNRNRAYDKMNGFNFFQSSKGWSSGPTALHLASEHKNNEIYILGFDYTGIDNKLNNIYANTFNYKKSHEKATYHGNWLRQTLITCQKFSEKRYIRVLGDDAFIPKEFSNIENLSHISIGEFKKIFNFS